MSSSSSSLRALVVDDEEAMREVLSLRLESWGFTVRTAANGAEAKRAAASFEPDVVISDVVMPDATGLELLPSLLEGDPRRPVILMTAHGTVEMAVEAMKQGARDFLTKPLDYDQLRALLEDALAELQAGAEVRQIAAGLAQGEGRFAEFVGSSPAMAEVYRQIEGVAPTDAPVLVTGESGTGKELAARSIHQLSPRSGGPLVVVNAAAIAAELMESEIFGHEKGAFTGAVGTRPGCFEVAHEGTLFLDEIGEMPMALQPKLLRVLEDGRVRRVGGTRERTFDVRLVAATNRDPKEAVEEGLLREDLYYRLNVFRLHLPPLRERREDLPLLTQHFLALLNAKHGTTVEGLRDEAAELMAAYAWPGNVRELKNVVERAVVLAKEGWIEASELPAYVREPTVEKRADQIILPLGVKASEAEKELILKTLEMTDNNKAEAARRLGLDVKTIRNKLKSYGLT